MTADGQGGLGALMTALLDRKDITADRDRADISERADAADPTESTEAMEPTDPIDSTEPIDPIDRTDPFEAMQSSESSDHRDQRELECGFVIHPSLVERSAACRQAPSAARHLANR